MAAYLDQFCSLFLLMTYPMVSRLLNVFNLATNLIINDLIIDMFAWLGQRYILANQNLYTLVQIQECIL